MARKNGVRYINKKKSFPKINEVGFAIEEFIGYRNDTPFLHGTDVVLLSYIKKGKGTHYMGSRSFEETPGMICVTHYGQQHSIVSENMDIINIYLQPDIHPLPHLPKPLHNVLPNIIPLHPNFYHKLNEAVRVKIMDKQKFDLLLDCALKEHESDGEGNVEALRLYLKLILIECCRSALNSFDAFPFDKRKEHFDADRVRVYLDDNFKENHSLDALSSMVELHPNYLCRVFKSFTGKSIFDYLADRRLQVAMLLLRTTNNKIIHVSNEAGFNDLSSFNRKFKQKLKFSPSAYRKLFQ
ncbi:MAG: hypothetical protein COA79_02580 [Planctomycetota bacterium]|nr:MAG: hypothetical protein COA79_02580 [Planctomycetota bacterium]